MDCQLTVAMCKFSTGTIADSPNSRAFFVNFQLEYSSLIKKIMNAQALRNDSTNVFENSLQNHILKKRKRNRIINFYFIVEYFSAKFKLFMSHFHRLHAFDVWKILKLYKRMHESINVIRNVTHISHI